MSAKHSTGNGVPAATYIRMSSDHQDASPKQQRDEIAKLAVRHGCDIAFRYQDDAISGDATDKRQSFQRMIRDAVAGKFKVILCWDQDRFGRFDSLEAGYYIHPLRQAGVSLVTVTDGVINWSDFTGRVMFGIKQEAKHSFLVDLSRNMLRGRAAAARRGEWLGRPPLGYRVVNKRLVVGDAEAVALVRRMFADYLAGQSLRAIAMTLNAEGVKTQLGASWKGQDVRSVLTNVAHIGTFKWGAEKSGKYNRFDGDAIIIPNNHPAIIDAATFAEVQRRLPARQRSTTPHQDGGGFVFTSLLRCGKCGAGMYGQRHHHSIRYRCCHATLFGTCDLNAAAQPELLDHVLRAIEERFTDPTTVRRLRDILVTKAKQRTRTVDVDDLQRRLAKLDTDLVKARRNMALADGSDLRREYEQVVRELRSEHDRLTASIHAAQKPPGRAQSELEQRVDRAVQTLARLRSATLAAPPAKQRELLAMVVQRVEVWSTRNGGRRSTYHLERGVVHLRPAMWLVDAEADKLSSSTARNR